MLRHLNLILLAACCSCVIAPSPTPSSSLATSATASPDSDRPAPGINEVFLDADDATIKKLVVRFEGESREIFAARNEIMAALRVTAGMAVGDVGAGTGLFEPLLSEAVGSNGKVYAVDLAPKMIEHLHRRIQEEKLSNVEVVQCTQITTELPTNSCDLIFICDTYHHFEHPQKTLADIKRALRPGGRLVIVDFYRKEGESRDWVMNHVRCGLATVVKEIIIAGFSPLENPKIEGLKENYAIIFTK